MKRIFNLVVILVFCLVNSPAFAVKTHFVYGGETPVTTQSLQEEAKALPALLAQTLVKVSGSTAVLNHPNIKAVLNKDLTDMVQSVSYGANTDGAHPFLLRIEFSKEAVDKLLQDNKLPNWGINRPLVLAWVSLEMSNKKPDIIDNTSVSPIQKWLKQTAKLRALPLILPMMDMTDINAVSPQDVIKNNKAVLEKASARYASDAIMVLNIVASPAGNRLQVHLLQGNAKQDWTVQNTNLELAIQTVVDALIHKLSQPATATQSRTQAAVTTITIQGITQQNDLSNIKNYLQGLPLITHLEMDDIEGDSVTFKLQLKASVSELINLLAISKKLVPIHPDSHNNELNYQWKPL